MKWGMPAMKSVRSYFNPGIIKQDVKQHGWIALIYLVGLLFALPLQLLMIASQENIIEAGGRYEHFFQVDLFFQVLFLFTVPILTGIFLFRYLQVRESADLIHSLPVRREQWLVNHLVSGMLLLVLPIIVTGLVLFFIRPTLPFADRLSTADLGNWVLVMIVMTVFFYFFTVFVGMITGHSIAQGVLTYIFLLLPTVFMELINQFFRIYLYGYSSYYMSQSNFDHWSPFLRFMVVEPRPISGTELLVYTGITIALFIVSTILYKWRHLEKNMQLLSFNVLKPIFKYGVTFCAMLVSGLYFQSSQNGSENWLHFGYVFGAVVGYLVAEMFLQKSWRIFRWSLAKGILGYGLVVILFVTSLQFDVFGFEKRVPALDEIEGVYFGGNAFHFNEEYHFKDRNVFSADSSFIHDVTALHKRVIERKPKTKPDPDSSTSPVFITYKLKDGSQLAREYVVPTKDIHYELKQAMEHPDYKYEAYRLYLLDKPILKIGIHGDQMGKSIFITDLEKITEMKKILKEEIQNQSYEEINDPRTGWSRIEVVFSDGMGEQYELKKSFDQLDKWLNDNGYLEASRIMPSEIESIEYASIENRISEYNKILESSKLFDDPEGISSFDPIKSTDQQLIEDLLMNYSPVYTYDNVIYLVKFNTKAGESFYGTVLKDFVPEQLKK